MKRRMIALALLVVLVAAVGNTAGEKPWFDLENCGMCTNITATPGLMESMQWEQHNLSNGVVVVTTVPKDKLEAYRAAHLRMSETGERLMKGEQMDLCGSCTALGMCMMRGVKQEYVETMNGDIWIVTSDNAEVVADLHEWIKKNKEAMAAMSEKKKS
ncbi:MAG: hypothetical protein IH989_07380 [Planctomycetes bacterium]|nr:hypothetical protein [Planctomycetota bacterium]